MNLIQNKHIQQAVNSWADSIEDTMRSPRSISALLRNRFNKFCIYPKITIEYIDMGGGEFFSLGAEYVYSNVYDFTLRLIFDPTSKHKKLSCNKAWIDDLRIELIEASVHEMQHKNQDAARDFDIMILPNSKQDTRTPDTKYLSNSEEIDAYSVSIAYGLFEQHGNQALTDFVNKSQSVRDMDHYVRTFRHDFNHPVIKTLYKKVYKYYKELVC